MTDPHYQRIVEQPFAVRLGLGLVGREQPADVGVQEARNRAMRIVVGVGGSVVLDMDGGPLKCCPCSAIEPSARKNNRTAGGALKLRCVSMRWKPIVMPRAVTEYIPPRMARSRQLTRRCHSSQIAQMVPTSGATTLIRVIVCLRGLLGIVVFLSIKGQ